MRWLPQRRLFFKQQNIVEVYRIIQIKMEIEQPKTNGVLKQLHPSQLLTISNETVYYQAIFQSPQFANKKIQISLTETHFVVKQLIGSGLHVENIFAAKLQFQLKIQIQYAEADKPASKKLGFTLYESNQKQNSFYSKNLIDIDSIIKILSRSLNQKGFHHQFKPVKKLGKGNFASVYEVIRVTDGQRFAVKAFSKLNTYCSPNGKQSLINQLSVLRSLSHYNLLHLESVYESDNSIYVVLEILKGKNMYDLIKQKNGSFTAEEVRKIMFGLLKGLKQMDEKRILHRDLKPENIMFRQNDEDYCPVIIDFGLATPCDIEKYLFYRCGTPGFVAPQIIKTNGHQKTEPACDMFSIGCIFHILLTGYPIFPGTQYAEVYQKNKQLQFKIKTQKINEKDSNALNLLNQMIIDNPIIRIKPCDALKHPFFLGIAANDESMEEEKDKIQVLSSITRQSTVCSN